MRPVAAFARGRSGSCAIARSMPCAGHRAPHPNSISTTTACSRASGPRKLTDSEAIRRETSRKLKGALAELPSEQSEVIALAYFGGFTHSEIAQMLAMPLGTVKGRMRLGLEKTRLTLAESMGARAIIGGVAVSRDFHADIESLRDDLAAYSLGALDATEKVALERHLEGCDSCLERLVWLRPAVDLLPGSVTQRARARQPAPELDGHGSRRGRRTTAGGRARSFSPTERASSSERRERWWQGLGNVMLRPASWR